jgi:hypothetical protein
MLGSIFGLSPTPLMIDFGDHTRVSATEPVDLAQHMIVGDMPLNTEAVNNASCITRRSPIIGRISRAPAEGISAPHRDQAKFFNIG